MFPIIRLHRVRGAVIFAETSLVIRMPDTSEKRRTFPYAVVLIVVGALLLFGNVGWFGLDTLFGLLARWWPLIFIFRGFSWMKSGIDFFGKGIRVLSFGLIMQVAMLGWLPENLVQLWPYILIAAGLWLILVPDKNAITDITTESSELNDHLFFRGVRIAVAAPRFAGGRLRLTAAAVDCDLSASVPGLRFMKLDLRAVLGRVRLFVPDEWRITIETSGAANSVRDHRDLGNPPESTDAPVLHITGSLSFASLDLLDPPQPAP
jgi:hypothetical protein